MNLASAIQKGLPTGLSATAALGVAATGYFAFNGALGVAEEYLQMNPDWKEKQLSKEERLIFVKKSYKHLLPTLGVGAATIAMIFGANKAHLGKEAALAGALAVYQATCGKKLPRKLSDIQQVLTDDALEGGLNIKVDAEHPEMINKHDYHGSGIKIDIWEPYTKQWFKATQQEILWAELTANKMLHQTGSVRLNQVLALYSDPNLKHDKKRGNELGWCWDDEAFEEASCYYYAGGWIDMCPQCMEVNGRMRFIMEYGINPNDISQ